MSKIEEITNAFGSNLNKLLNDAYPEVKEKLSNQSRYDELSKKIRDAFVDALFFADYTLQDIEQHVIKAVPEVIKAEVKQKPDGYTIEVSFQLMPEGVAYVVSFTATREPH